VCVNLFRPPPHVLVLKANNPLADGGFAFCFCKGFRFTLAPDSACPRQSANVALFLGLHAVGEFRHFACMCGQGTSQDRFISFRATGLKRTVSEPGFVAKVLWPLVGMAGDGNDSRFCKRPESGEGDSRENNRPGRASPDRRTSRVRPKCGRNVECLHPTVSHMHLSRQVLQRANPRCRHHRGCHRR